MAYKGKFKPKNPEKYKGDPNKIVYRSSWERRVMGILDMNPNVILWNSEEVVVPYQCATDYKMHRYFIDFWVKLKNPDGTTREELWEVKPKKQCQPPKKQGRNKKRYLIEQARWLKNASKWNAAKQFAKKRGMDFYLVTEESIFGSQQQSKVKS